MSEKASKVSQYSFTPPSSTQAGVGGVTISMTTSGVSRSTSSIGSSSVVAN